MLVNMYQMLNKAKDEGYGIGFFNAVNVEMARAVIEKAEELRSPIIIGTAEVLLTSMPLENVADYLIPMARRASVPVAVHFDHGLTFDNCMKALRLGFSSIMYDCSTLPYEQNVSNVAEMVRICHAMGATVEGELGHVGDNEGDGRLDDPKAYFTSPDMAADFTERTGVDALAVAVGNAHGDYAFPPKLDFERIEAIRDMTDIPLVLHGGSGLSDDDFRISTRKGICKINIFTDIDKAGKRGLDRGISSGAGSIFSLINYEIEAMKEVVENKIRLFGSEGMA